MQQRQQQNLNIDNALKILELPTTTFLPVAHAESPQQAQQELKIFQDTIKKQRKILSKKYHPDVYDGNDDKIKQINNIVDFIKTMKIMVRPRPVVQVFHHVFTSHYNHSTTTSTSYSDIFRTQY